MGTEKGAARFMSRGSIPARERGGLEYIGDGIKKAEP